MSKMSNKSIAFNRRTYAVFNYTGKCEIGNAYIMGQTNEDPHMFSLFDNMVLPCIKRIELDETNRTDLEPGIYLTKKGPFIIKPCDPEYYSVKRIRGLNDGIDPELIIDSTEEEISSVVSGDIYLPKRNDKDDINNKLFKVAISLKKIALSMFAKRLGSDKYNFIRAIEHNLALSASKLVNYTSIFELQFAIVIADKPSSKHPIGRQIVIYSDQEFEFNNPLNYDEAVELVENIVQEDAYDE